MRRPCIPLPLLAAPGGFTFRELCPNLVANPGFQASGAVPDQWSFASGAAGTTVTYDNTNGHISLGCVKIHVPGTASVQSGYPKSAFFAAVPGATYTFSAWGRSSGVNGINPPTVRVAEVDRNNAFIINRTLSFPRDSAEWVKQTMTFTASTNAAKFYVYANLYNSYGTFWVDDVWVNTRAEINLIDNPDFDTATGGVPDQWSYMSGAGAVAYDNTDGHSALGCVKIDVPGTNSVQSGYPKSAYIEAMPGVSYTFSAWAKSSGVNGTNQPAVRVFELDGNNAYILNRMLVFPRDSAGWEKREISFIPSANTAKFYVIANLYNSYGTFWVDDVSLSAFSTRKIPLGGAFTQNGDGSLTQSATVSDIQFDFTYSPKARHIEVQGDIHDLTGESRAISVQYGLPVNADGWQWHDDIMTARTIASGTQYEKTFKIGAARKQNYYPFSCIGDGERGLGLAVPMDEPRIYRTGYNTGEGFSIDYDFGLANGTAKIGNGSAGFTFDIYKLDEPGWGFRSLAKKYYELYPGFFERKNEREGIWYFSNESPADTVSGSSDFGFAFHVAHYLPPNARVSDRQAGIYPVQYTEPMGWWRIFGTNSTKPTYSESMAALSNDLQDVTHTWRSVVPLSVAAQIVTNSAPYDEEGQMCLDNSKLWADWGTWCLNYPTNPDPDLPSPNRVDLSYEKYDRSNTPTAPVDSPCMGIHVDSLMADWSWGAETENYRTSHWQYADFPLAFSYQTKQPVLLGALSQYDNVQGMYEDMKAIGKRVDANIFPTGYSLYGNVVDVLGGEQFAIKLGDFRAALCRTTSYHKTNRNWLQNTAATGLITHAEVETLLNEHMFWGMFPSIGIAGPSEWYADVVRYWSTPDLYNRDRDLFKKYMPVIREISASGWEPIPHAVCDNDNIRIERYGRVYFAVNNRTNTVQSGAVTIDLAGAGLSVGSMSGATAVECCSGSVTNLTFAGNQAVLAVNVNPGQTLVYKLGLDVVGNWSLNQTANDSSGYGNHGALVNMPAPVWTNGISGGKALVFDGTSGYVDLHDPASLTLRNNIAVEAWFKPNTANEPAMRTIYSRGEAVALTYVAGAVRFYVRNSESALKAAQFTLNDTAWHHVVGVYADPMVRLYVDGVLRDTQTLGGSIRDASVDSPNTIGCKYAYHTGNNYYYDQFFNGAINEVKILNRVPTPDEVFRRYECQAANWHLDETAGTLALDSSVYANNGTLTNMNLSTCRVDGKIGKALMFDGTSGYVNLKDPASLTVRNRISVEAWFKPNTANEPARRTIYSRGESLALSYVAGSVWFFVRNTASSFKIAQYSLNDTAWHHAVGVYSDPTLRLYVDGVLRDTKTLGGSIRDSSYDSPNTLGCQYAYHTGFNLYNDYFFNGAIDEVKIYGRELTADEILQRFNGQAGNWIPLNAAAIFADDPSDCGSKGTVFTVF